MAPKVFEYSTQELASRYPFYLDEFEKTLKKIQDINFKQNAYHAKYLAAVCKFSLENALCLNDGLTIFKAKYGTEIPAKYIPLSEHKEDLKREVTKSLKIPQILKWLGKYIK